MVRSIVIPHDPARSPRLRELADVGDFQAAVDGWIEPLEMPSLGVTLYVNEAARRDRAPINCRAMALWWLYTADPTSYPLILGDVVLTGSGRGSEEESGDVPERLIREIFETTAFVVQAKPFGVGPWRDTYAQFGNIFDAATWCMLFTYCLRPGSYPGVPRGGGLSGPRRRDRDGVSHRAMVSENDQELTQKDDTARWLLTSLPSSSCSGN